MLNVLDRDEANELGLDSVGCIFGILLDLTTRGLNWVTMAMRAHADEAMDDKIGGFRRVAGHARGD